MSMPDDDLRRRATLRADKKIGFFSHLSIFVLVNGGLIILNLLTSPTSLWFFWPLMGWGIGLVAHGISLWRPFENMRAKMIEAEVDRLKTK